MIRWVKINSAFLPGLLARKPSSLEVVGETDEKQYQLAKSYQSQGRTDEALSAFLRVIDARRDARNHISKWVIFISNP